jgi:hypothetical protein
VAGHDYVVRVRAGIGKYIGAWASSTPLAVLGTPVVTGLQYDAASGAIIVHWDSVDGADSYEIEMRDPIGRLLRPSVGTTVKPMAGSTQTAALPGGSGLNFVQAVSVIIQARKGTSTGPWSDPGPFSNDKARVTLQKLAAPTITAADGSAGTGRVSVTWTGIQPPQDIVISNHVIELLTKNVPISAVIATPSASPTAAKSTAIDIPGGGPIGVPPKGGTTPAACTARVRATTPALLGLWSAEVPVNLT